jgi:flagellar basal-body rod modification protein FlgD
MGKDDFMQLLIAQLKNQDPMKPMEDKEFISQLAQFSSLESMDKMTKQIEDLTGAEMLVQAATLIGKQATAKLETGEVVSGTISQVKMLSGQPTAVINGKEIDTSLITTIGA